MTIACLVCAPIAASPVLPPPTVRLRPILKHQSSRFSNRARDIAAQKKGCTTGAGSSAASHPPKQAIHGIYRATS